MSDLESLFHGISCNLAPRKTELVEEIPFFPTTVRQIASAGESKGDCNNDSSNQWPELGCDEDFRTMADLDFHMNLLFQRVSPVPVGMSESLYDKVKR